MSARGSSAWREEHWAAWRCAEDRLVRFEVVPGVPIRVADAAADAFRVLGAVFQKHRYQLRPGVTGAFNCRRMTGGGAWSAHAYGIAGDFNWDTNPYTDRLVTDMPEELTDEAQGIVTSEGVRVWRWGGDWDHRPDTRHERFDAMHFEVVATPAELEVGLYRTIETKVAALWPTLIQGDRGPAVEHLQRKLRMAQGGDVEIDGAFGPGTAEAVRRYQRSRGLRPDAVVGPATWTALTEGLPELAPGDPTPSKGVQT